MWLILLVQSVPHFSPSLLTPVARCKQAVKTRARLAAGACSVGSREVAALARRASMNVNGGAWWKLSTLTLTTRYNDLVKKVKVVFQYEAPQLPAVRLAVVCGLNFAVR